MHGWPDLVGALEVSVSPPQVANTVVIDESAVDMISSLTIGLRLATGAKDDVTAWNILQCSTDVNVAIRYV